jgi:hypothetical protein
VDDDREAFEAGRRIAAGGRDRRDFLVIFERKTSGRGRPRPALNTDAEIADALDLAMAARTERAAVAVQTGLSGVEIPVASAVLTAVDPGPLHHPRLPRVVVARRGAEDVLLGGLLSRISHRLPPDRGRCRHRPTHVGKTLFGRPTKPGLFEICRVARRRRNRPRGGLGRSKPYSFRTATCRLIVILRVP